jgi:mannose-6-phosphate isomerase-like protein (cupin superfamily)
LEHVNKISRANAEHYIWGQQCDGWRLVKSPELSVIEERMPPGAFEVSHYHQRSRQFFRVLLGELQMLVQGTPVVLAEGEGLEIAPGIVHQARNTSRNEVRFLVISQPPSQGDRILADG